MSTHPRTYWWPRRKHHQCGRGNLKLCSSNRSHTGHHRDYNTGGVERRIYDASQDIPFIDGFPERLIREGLPERLKRKGIKRSELVIEDMLGSSMEEKSGGEPLHEEAEEHKDIPEDQTATPADSSTELDVSPVSDYVVEEHATPVDSSTGLDISPVLDPVLEEHVPQVDSSTELDVSPVSDPVTEEHATPADSSTELDMFAVPDPAIELAANNSAIAHRLEQEHETSTTIHILGATRHGKYIAHSLAGLPHAPPVTLLLHTHDLMRRWNQEGAAVRVLRQGKLIVQTGIDVEFSGDYDSRGFQGHIPRRRYAPNESVIHNLIVTTDGFATLPALEQILHRIRPWTSICFLQDGMGITDQVNSTLYPDPLRRPHYALGHISHKLTPTERAFTVIEREAGNTSLSVLMRATKRQDQFLSVPEEEPLIRRLDNSWGPFIYLLRTLTRSPELRAQARSRPDFHVKQLEKLAVNAVLGPLSVLYDCPNDQLLNNYNIQRTMRLVLQETSLILRSLPEISRVAGINRRFSVKTLEQTVMSVIKKTRGNTTTMQQLVKAGRRTGVEFYNGYLISRAMELGMACPHNEMLLSMVQAKQAVSSRKDEWFIPVRDE